MKKTLLPLFHTIVADLASVISDERKRNIFMELLHGVKPSEIVRMYDLPGWNDANLVYFSAQNEILRKAKFLSDYRRRLAGAERKIRKLEIENLKMKKQLGQLAEKGVIAQLDEDIEAESQDPENVKAIKAHEMLSVSLFDKRFGYSFRLMNCMHAGDIYTIGDLFAYVKEFDCNFEFLLRFRNFGKVSYAELMAGLRKERFINKQNRSWLFEYV